MQLERVDHHQIVAEAEIFNRQPLGIDEAVAFRSHLGEAPRRLVALVRAYIP